MHVALQPPMFAEERSRSGELHVVRDGRGGRVVQQVPHDRRRSDFTGSFILGPSDGPKSGGNN